MQSLYHFFYKIHRNYFLRKQKTLPFKVISVGNITTGGTGKTPTVIEIALAIVKKGYQPIILTRGYKGAIRKPTFVTPKNLADGLYHGHPRDVGDESILMAEKLPCVPVIKAKNRFEGGIFALKHLERYKNDTGCNISDEVVFILDDGFQHWRLHRDIDIVVIDGSNPFGNKKLLPFGILREPLTELKRADMFIVTRSLHSDLIDTIRLYNSNSEIFYAKTTAVRLIDIQNTPHPLDKLKDKRPFVFAGIGNNEQFRRMIQDLSSVDVQFKAFNDHHYYTVSDISSIKKSADAKGCNIILTTEKDIIKIRHIKADIHDIYAVEIRLEIQEGFYDLLFSRLI
ncbi:MAG: tetraacyldisaccharide 4'-kinase [Thermodesulfovibrionales bacterium]